MQLAREVYQLTGGFPKSELFGLVMQMRRAAVSVPSNIAEGHGRLTDNSLRVFLAQARGSLYELETQTQLAVDLGYTNAKQAAQLNEACDAVARLLNGLLRAIRNAEPTR
jgi:four helix bundle protein